MGIQGLLPLLRECQQSTHLRHFKGQTLAIDAYVWLHRGAYGCAEDVATGKQTVKYIQYAMHRIRLLKHYGITPYVVFDGGLLPSKLRTERDREGIRTEALAQASALASQGKHAQARDFYVKAVDVTPQMAYQLIKALRAENVSYVVAPYEADAQLAYLEKQGIVNGIITEDSDLLVFGCRNVLFKLDSDGACVQIERDNFTQCREFSFSGWSDVEFRHMAILSGCDYLVNIPGLGIKKAHGLMRKYKSAEKAIRFLRLDGQFNVPQNYEKEFKRADLTFLYQRVFDPETQRLTHLNTLPPHLRKEGATLEALRFVGPDLTPEMAVGIATGEVCPLSRAKMIDIVPDAVVPVLQTDVASAAGTKSIKDFFKPIPAAPVAKRAAIPEVKGVANLFTGLASTKDGAPQLKNAPLVKSRFFAAVGAASAAAGPARTTQPAESAVSSFSAIADLEATPATQPAHSHKVAHEREPAGANFALHSSHTLTTKVSAPLEAYCSLSDQNMPDPTEPERFATPESDCLYTDPVRMPLSESGLSHISSPGNISSHDKARAKVEVCDSGRDNHFEFSDGVTIISSPGMAVDSIQATGKRGPRDISVDRVFNPISPSASATHGSRLNARESPSLSPAQRQVKGKKRALSDALEWSSDLEHSTASQGGVVRMFTRPISLPKPQLSKKVKLPRRNAVTTRRQISAVEAEDGTTPGSADISADIKSVMSSWREKYSSTLAPLVKERSRSTSVRLARAAPRVMANTPQLVPAGSSPSQQQDSGFCAISDTELSPSKLSRRTVDALNCFRFASSSSSSDILASSNSS